MADHLAALAMQEEDVRMMLAAQVHIGTKNVDAQMSDYVYKRAKSSGSHIINLAKTWEKLMLAARVLVAIENPEDICVVSNRQFGQRAAYKFGQYTGAHVVSGRYTPGTFTNQICRNYVEPRILLVCDPHEDAQPVKEASYVNIPVIAFCDTDSPVANVDIAIPCSNKGKDSLAVMFWMLTREVLRMRASISRQEPWDVAVDLFIFKTPEQAQEEMNRNQENQIDLGESSVPRAGTYDEYAGNFAQQQVLDQGVTPQQEPYAQDQQQLYAQQQQYDQNQTSYEQPIQQDQYAAQQPQQYQQQQPQPAQDQYVQQQPVAANAFQQAPPSPSGGADWGAE